jgi:DNA replication protein DnaC
LLETVPHRCSVCDGLEWKPVSGGRVAECECRKARIAAARARAVGIPARYEHCELINFDVVAGECEHSQALALELSKDLARDYPLGQCSRGLAFVGGPGVGKTHLTVGILKQVLQSKRVVRCLFRDYRDLLAEIRRSYSRDAEMTELEVLRPVLDADVLALDDVGAERPKDFVLDMISTILNHRYNHRKVTILTTNFADQPPACAGDEFSYQGRRARNETVGDRIGEPMRSRIHEMCRIVELGGGDFRQRVYGATQVAEGPAMPR